MERLLSMKIGMYVICEEAQQNSGEGGVRERERERERIEIYIFIPVAC